jgi:RNA polymerase sigma-70 factor (ECF subfamily)
MLLGLAAAPVPVETDAPGVPDDGSAVARAKLDRAAFEPLYRAYLGPIYGYCYHRLGDVAAAEDATQQVFTQALARLHTCRDTSFRSWLFSIAHNLTIDLARSARRTAPIEEADAISSGAASPEELAIQNDLASRLHAALTHLTPEQRDVITLRFSGLSSPETARVLNSTDAAVRQIQHRALVKLRTLMVPEPAPKVANDG